MEPEEVFDGESELEGNGLGVPMEDSGVDRIVVEVPEVEVRVEGVIVGPIESEIEGVSKLL